MKKDDLSATTQEDLLDDHTSEEHLLDDDSSEEDEADETADALSLDEQWDEDSSGHEDDHEDDEEMHLTSDDEDSDESLSASDSFEEDDEDRAALTPPKQRLLVAMTLAAKVEAIIFASAKPLKITEIHEILADEEVTEQDVQGTLNQLMIEYQDRSGGFGLHYIKRLGYQFQTSQAAGPIMERMFASRPRPISRAALETLTIIAYRQPVTRAEIEFIRGVDAGSIIKNLLERELIKCVGRKEIVGRPMLFGTTDEFLKVFNLSTIKDLPPLESFQPSREAVKDALEKIDGDHDPVDIEQYIADHTSEAAEDEDFAELEMTEESAPRQIQGGQLDKEETVDGEMADTDLETSNTSDTDEVITTEQSEASETEHHGTIETAEVDSTFRDSVEKGS